MTPAVIVDIDLRSDCHAIRDQGQRATCVVCATSDAHAMHHRCAPLSVEYLFFHAIRLATVGNVTDGLTFPEVRAALDRRGQPAESDWPYSLIQPSPWTPPVVSKIWRAALQHDPSAVSSDIFALLAARRPVILGIRLSAAFLAPALPDFVIPAGGDGFGGHAVLVVGTGHDENGEVFFLIRNSWGEAWGDRGYAWLATGYLASKFIGHATIAGQP